MMIFRPTASLAKKMKIRFEESSSASNALLGDWVCNDLSIYGKWYVVSVSTTTRIQIITEAAPYKNWTGRFKTDLIKVLEDFEIPQETISQELECFTEVIFSKTNNRSVMGTLNDGIKNLKYLSTFPEPIRKSIAELTSYLNRTPISSLEETWPEYQLRKTLGLEKRKRF